MPVSKLTDRLKMPMLKGGLIAVLITLSYFGGRALAREGSTQPVPIPIPASHAKARARCPLDKPLQCRAALIHAYEAITWQRNARQHAQATTVREITLDAITWAAAKYGVSASEMRTVGNCESHLWPFATNGQYAGAWQLSTRHRSDPIFAVVPWQDAYAEASHVARYVKAHGWGEWQCMPSGGLRW